VFPETFDGTGSWRDWCFHFENVATVNGWDDTQKLQWLRVRITRRAQKATSSPRVSGHLVRGHPGCPEGDPESRHTQYQAEFQARSKKTTEGWADLFF
jgi:hypothetical protein